MSGEVLRYAAFPAGDAGGNPAGVVLDARGMTDEEMLAVAAEVGFSETAFLFPAESSADRIGAAPATPRCATSVPSPRCRSAVTPRSPPRSPTPSVTAPDASTWSPAGDWCRSTPVTRVVGWWPR